MGPLEIEPRAVSNARKFKIPLARLSEIGMRVERSSRNRRIAEGQGASGPEIRSIEPSSACQKSHAKSISFHCPASLDACPPHSGNIHCSSSPRMRRHPEPENEKESSRILRSTDEDQVMKLSREEPARTLWREFNLDSQDRVRCIGNMIGPYRDWLKKSSGGGAIAARSPHLHDGG